MTEYRQCVHCCNPIQSRRFAPGWTGLAADLGSFCPAVDGGPHEPVTGVADECESWLRGLPS